MKKILLTFLIAFGFSIPAIAELSKEQKNDLFIVVQQLENAVDNYRIKREESVSYNENYYEYKPQKTDIYTLQNEVYYNQKIKWNDRLSKLILMCEKELENTNFLKHSLSEQKDQPYVDKVNLIQLQHSLKSKTTAELIEYSKNSQCLF